MFDDELDRFKRIPLLHYAVEVYGYQHVPRESGPASLALRHPSTGDKIIVRRDVDGHWTYFSVRDDLDNGTILDFVQSRGRRSNFGHIRQELRQWLGTPRPERDDWTTYASSTPPARDPRTVAKAFDAARITGTCAYLESRGLTRETLYCPWDFVMPDFKPQASESDAIRQNLERIKQAQPERYAELERNFERVRERQENAEALESAKRTIHLAEYAQTRGYRPSPTDSTHGVTVLEHPQTRDRVAVAKTQDGQWIFASLPDYKPPPRDGEPVDLTRERLRDCIARTRDKGSVVEFVQHCERVVGRPEPSVAQVREHLRQWQDRQRELELVQRSPADAGRAQDGRTDRDRNGEARDPRDPNRRIGDWSPASGSLHPSEAEVQERLSRLQDAQRAIDLKLARASELAKTQLAPAVANHAPSRNVDKSHAPGELPRNPGGEPAPNLAKRSLAQRRYDWTPPVGPAPKAVEPLLASRGPDRSR
jgi:hypothetical protein